MTRLMIARFLILLSVLMVLSSACSNDQNQYATAEQQKEFTPEPYYPDMEAGAELPIDVKINLLNSPQKAGDVAEFELMFTSRNETESSVEATFILPAASAQTNGALTWQGSLEKNQTQRMRMSARIDSEALLSVQAKVTVQTANGSVTRGAAYELDLGEKDQATTHEQRVEGYEGGNTLNVIVPKK